MSNGTFTGARVEILRSIIVDDEERGRDNLKYLISQYCPELEVVATAASAEEAREFVSSLKPDVVFLDIEMPEKNGFDFLDFYNQRPFAVIFVTAFGKHALRAIKASAVDYILKPIAVSDLKEAVRKLLESRKNEQLQDIISSVNISQTQVLLENLRKGHSFERIMLTKPRGFKIVHVNDILYLKSEGVYTLVHLVEGETCSECHTLKEYESMLDPEVFYRIHKSYLLNLYHVSEFEYSNTGGIVTLTNGEKLKVSARRVSQFTRYLQEFTGFGATRDQANV